MTRKLNLVLIALIVILGIPFYWLMLDAGSGGNDVAKPVTIAQLRALATSLPGAAPIEVRYEQVGRRQVTSDLLAAGSGLRASLYVVRAFELVLPGAPGISIDRGLRRETALALGIGDLDPAAQTRVDRTVARARLRLLLEPEPVHGNKAGASLPPGSGSSIASGQQFAFPYAAAPGVVVIPADGVVPGARMVYVRLADGAELLFAGDIAPLTLSWRQQRPPARLMTRYLRRRDRDEIAAWLRTIRSLKDAAPALTIVAGHDGLVPSSLHQGFVPDPSRQRQIRSRDLR